MEKWLESSMQMALPPFMSTANVDDGTAKHTMRAMDDEMLDFMESSLKKQQKR